MKNFQHLAFINRKHEIIYDREAICKELDDIASGETYHENALIIAKGLPELDDDDRDELNDWLIGADKKIEGSHILQEVIQNIRDARRKIGPQRGK